MSMNVGGISCEYISIINNTRVWSSLNHLWCRRRTTANRRLRLAPLLSSAPPWSSALYTPVSFASKTDNVLHLQARQTHQMQRSKEHIAAWERKWVNLSFWADNDCYDSSSSHWALYIDHSPKISLLPRQMLTPGRASRRGNSNQKKHQRRHSEGQWDGQLIWPLALPASSLRAAGHAVPWMQPGPRRDAPDGFTQSPGGPVHAGASGPGHRRHWEVLAPLRVSLRGHLTGDRHGGNRRDVHLQHAAPN